MSFGQYQGVGSIGTTLKNKITNNMVVIRST